MSFKFESFFLTVLFSVSTRVESLRQIDFVNTCNQPLTLFSDANKPIKSLQPNEKYTRTISDAGEANLRFFAKINCSPNCANTPADTLVEFTFHSVQSQTRTYYDISLVDGYTLPVTITPSGQLGDRCKSMSCRLSSCPANEVIPEGQVQLGNLLNSQNPHVCLSPCTKVNLNGPGSARQTVCCPVPQGASEDQKNKIVSDCQRNGGVKDTQFVQQVHTSCPGAYAYSFDDAHGSQDCPASTSYTVSFMC